MPGDPVEVMLGETAAPADRQELREALGLDQPVSTQYASFMKGLITGSLGSSIHSGRPVAEMIADRFGPTLELTLAAMIVALLIAIPAGTLSAGRPGGWFDRATLTGSLFGVAIPNFWLGPMLISVFAIQFALVPISGRGTLAHLILPAVTLGLGMAGILTRMIRSSLAEAMHEDYVRTARAKGLSESRIISKHAMANALTPILSIVGLQLGALLGGSVITETIFAWPGLGALTVQSIQTRDYPVVQGAVLVIALSYVVVNVVTDIAYAWVNPKIRSEMLGDGT